MSGIFDDARLKIARAFEHITSLEKEISVFLSTSPFRLVHKGDANIYEEMIYIKIEKEIPKYFSVIIGDAVHNLRTALDYAIYALLFNKVDEKHLKQIQFPFGKTQLIFEDELKKRQIILAGTKIHDAVKSLCPYLEGNKALYSIHYLDIEDKHKLLIPVTNISSFSADDWRTVHPALGRIFGPGIIALTSKNAGFRIPKFC